MLRATSVSPTSYPSPPKQGPPFPSCKPISAGGSPVSRALPVTWVTHTLVIVGWQEVGVWMTGRVNT